jgi:hypothetical protein
MVGIHELANAAGYVIYLFRQLCRLVALAGPSGLHGSCKTLFTISGGAIGFVIVIALCMFGMRDDGIFGRVYFGKRC